MCGRFSLFVPPGDLEARFGAELADSVPRRYNIAPGDEVAAIRNDADGLIDRLEWGLLPGWVNDPADYPRPINARAESIAEKPSFRGAFAERRCLVLADGFFEWREYNGSKQPYRITRRDEEPFAFAGLWEAWGPDGDRRRTATIVTTAANETVAPIHDRMPAILAPEEERRWLAGGDPETLQAMLDPSPGGDLVTFPVSQRVNDPSNDSPDVVEPVDVGEQAGLDEFG